MVDNFLKYLLRRARRFKEVEESVKKNSVLTAIILMLAMSVFFCAISKNYALAEKPSDRNSQKTSFKAEYIESIGGLQNLDLNLKSKKNARRT